MEWTQIARQSRSLEPEIILFHDMRGNHHMLTAKRGGTLKCLGVLFDPALTERLRLICAITEFKKIMAAVATRKAPPELSKAALESSLLNKVA